MNVHDVTIFSDHCLLTMQLICGSVSNNDINTDCRHVLDKFQWSDEAKLKFQEALYAHEIQNKLSDIKTLSLVEDNLHYMIIFAGDKSLKDSHLKKE